MKWTTVGCAILITGCVNAPPPDNPASSARSQERNEARGLEAAEADCARQGKHAVSQRVEGETLYNCVD
jgi:hypothetical protein